MSSAIHERINAVTNQRTNRVGRGQANPALDLGGRIMLSVIGYTSAIWTGPDATPGYAWVNLAHVPLVLGMTNDCAHRFQRFAHS